VTDRAIADYGMLSDCHSAALVSGEGSIDWLCFPRFDSPSLFGRILDAEAGHWSIHPVAEFDIRRRYLPGSLVLETQFTTADGMAMVTDALVVPHDEQDGIGAGAPHVLVRVAEATEGTVEMAVEYSPRPEYGLVRPRLDAVDGDPPDAVVVTGGGADHLWLSGPPPDVVADGQAHWRILLHPGERVSFALGHSAQRDPAPLLWHREEIGRRLDLTVQAWRQWSGRHQPHQLVGPQRVGTKSSAPCCSPHARSCSSPLGLIMTTGTSVQARNRGNALPSSPGSGASRTTRSATTCPPSS